MKKLIIWSKDRACQLHLLLESIAANCPNLFDEIDVITKGSSDEYNIAYSMLENRFEGVNLIHETKPFWQHTNESAQNADCVTFATDDCVVYRPLETPIRLPKENETFSLRLGLNTLKQDIHRGSFQSPLLHYEESDGIISWDVSYRSPQENYGYPFSLDFHIFDGNLIRELLQYCSDYATSNHLEGRLCQHRHRISRIMSFKQNIAVNIPCNNLSQNTVAGQFYSYSTKQLNDAYLEGKKIKLDFDNVVGAHQEFPYTFIGVNE